MNKRTRIIRNVAIGVGTLYLVAAGVVLSINASQVLLIYLAVAGVLIMVSVFTMRGGGQPDDEGPRGYWQMTGERFRDPATGHMMEIRHNPITGERDYVEVADGEPPS